MNHPSKATRILTVALFGSVALSALFQTLAFLLAYNAPATNYFKSHSPLPVFAVVFALLAILTGLALAVLLPKGSAAPKQLPMRKASLFAAAGFLAGAVILLFSAEHSGLISVTFVTLFLAALYNLLAALMPEEKNATVSAVGFAAIIGCIMINAIYYFDMSLEMNAPLKVSVMTGLLALTVYFTGELRILLEKPMPRTYLFLSSFLLGTSALSAIPIPLAFLSGKFNRDFSNTGAPALEASLCHVKYLAGAVILLGCGLTVGIRLFHLLLHPTAEISDPQALRSEAAPSSDQTLDRETAEVEQNTESESTLEEANSSEASQTDEKEDA